MPTAVICTDQFVASARAQAAICGNADYPFVVVPHPIQPLTRDEVRALADKAFDEILRRLTA